MGNESESSFSFPFFPVYLFQLVLNTTSICVAILMLRLVQATQLHPNCKYLLKTWSLGYLSLFVSHGVVSWLNVIAEELPTRKIGPPIRSYFLSVSVSSQFVCALTEIAIASERLMSAMRPAAYYVSGKSVFILYPATAAVICIAALSGYNTEFRSDHFLDAAAIVVIDVATLTVNSISVRYCAKRYEQMHGKVSLNARYQIREAQEIASSMQRSYVVCFLFKNCFNCFVLVGCAYTDEITHVCLPLHPLASGIMPYHFIESMYTGGLSCTSCYLLCWLMTNHPRLRKKLYAILAVVGGKKLQQGQSVVENRQSVIQTETDFYFDSLKKSWA